MTLEIPDTATPDEAARLARAAKRLKLKRDAELSANLEAARQHAKNAALMILMAYHRGERPGSWEKLDPHADRFCGSIDPDSGDVTISTEHGTAAVDLLGRPRVMNVFENVAGVFAISVYCRSRDTLAFMAVGACEGVFNLVELPEVVGAWLNC